MRRRLVEELKEEEKNKKSLTSNTVSEREYKDQELIKYLMASLGGQCRLTSENSLQQFLNIYNSMLASRRVKLPPSLVDAFVCEVEKRFRGLEQEVLVLQRLLTEKENYIYQLNVDLATCKSEFAKIDEQRVQIMSLKAMISRELFFSSSFFIKE